MLKQKQEKALWDTNITPYCWSNFNVWGIRTSKLYSAHSSLLQSACIDLQIVPHFAASQSFTVCYSVSLMHTMYSLHSFHSLPCLMSTHFSCSNWQVVLKGERNLKKKKKRFYRRQDVLYLPFFSVEACRRSTDGWNTVRRMHTASELDLISV